jgi:hypothetical protein
MAKLTPEEVAAAIERTAGLVNEERLGRWSTEAGSRPYSGDHRASFLREGTRRCCASTGFSKRSTAPMFRTPRPTPPVTTPR